MREYLKKIFLESPKTKKVVGVVLVFIGVVAILTPLTPGSGLIFVGFELLGFRFLLWDNIKKRFKK